MSESKANDWTCSDCGNHNFSKRHRCHKCGAVKALAPTAANSKSGDWVCTGCHNLNWARRDRCNICNGPKPSKAEAVRTGRGGGHYDRQDQAERDTHWSDEEEYDVFGRLKRRRKTPAAPAPVAEPQPASELVAVHFPPAPISESDDEEFLRYSST